MADLTESRDDTGEFYVDSATGFALVRVYRN
jgi:hypothetical protein